MQNKSVKFSGEVPKSEHFTKPSYLGNMSPRIEQPRDNRGNGIGRSNSLPQINAPNNIIPTKSPSQGFKPSFLPSEGPKSARNQNEMLNKQPISYPSGYGDNSQLGASAARISELIKKSENDNHSQWFDRQSDCKYLISLF